MGRSRSYADGGDGAGSVRREYAGSGQLAGFSGYFVMQFDRKVARSGIWIGDQAELRQDATGRRRTAAWGCKGAKMMTSTGGASAAAMSQPTSGTRPGFGRARSLRTGS